MYYIINETHDIIAADKKLLELCGFSQVNELTSNIILKKLSFKTMPDNQMMITTELESYTFLITYTSLSSLLGKLTLITLDTSKRTSQTIDEDTIDIKSLIIKSKAPDDFILINDIEKEITAENEGTVLDLDAPLDLLSLDIDHTPTAPVENRELTPAVDIIVDVTKVSKSIGISEEDFTLFLNEYIDTALDLEKDLQSNDKQTCSTAINTLLHLSEVLHLDEVNHILLDIDKSTDDTHMYYVTSFYDALSRITTKKDEVAVEDIVLLDLLIEDDTNESNVPLDTHNTSSVLPDIEIKPEPVSPIESEININTEETPPASPPAYRDTIDLSTVDPIRFDFQISVAADELSLPQDLIEEFMIDFLEQAHIETDKMLVAYQAGDLDSIQKIGHLLKGVSSNLRITALSDTLYKIQFSEEIDDIPDLIKTYWGHFLFFEKQIKRLPN